MEKTVSMYNDIERILVTRREIDVAVKKLGDMITEQYEGKELVMVCILKGAALFFSDLIREVSLPMVIDFMSASSYGSGTESKGEVRIKKDLDRPIAGKHVILVEDIVDTGNTIYFLQNYLKDRGAASVRVATLLDKPARRKVPLKADYYCFTIPDAFVVGYGLDYDEKYRNLPDIGILSPGVYGAEG